MTNKRYGRVGDAPIIGAGTYANSQCAVSGTGWGEFYIRAVAAYDICARMKYAGQSLQQAADTVIDRGDSQGRWRRRCHRAGCAGQRRIPVQYRRHVPRLDRRRRHPHVAIFKDETL